MEQLGETLGALDVSLTENELERLGGLAKCPKWMIQFQNERESR